MKNYTNLKFFMNMASVGVVRLSLPATQIFCGHIYEIKSPLPNKLYLGINWLMWRAKRAVWRRRRPVSEADSGLGCSILLRVPVWCRLVLRRVSVQHRGCNSTAQSLS